MLVPKGHDKEQLDAPTIQTYTIKRVYCSDYGIGSQKSQSDKQIGDRAKKSKKKQKSSGKTMTFFDIKNNFQNQLTIILFNIFVFKYFSLLQ